MTKKLWIVTACGVLTWSVHVRAQSPLEPLASQYVNTETGITLAEYYRDMGYRVALMIDSISRWAEALREISSRLQEMPGEEGYPTSLSSRFGTFLERAGRVQPLGSNRSPGAVTIVSAISREVFLQVPTLHKEAALAIGATRWEMIRLAVLPYGKSGIIGGAMLGLGRALGETMAVTFVIGNAHRIAPSLFAPGTSISAAIANEFTEATSDLYRSALIELGLLLFVITFIVLACAQLMLRRMERSKGH